MADSSSIDGSAVATAVATDLNVLKAIEHNNNNQKILQQVCSNNLPQAEGARLCVDECTKGIDLLKSAPGTHIVLNVLSVLREQRARYALLVIIDDICHQRESPSDIEKRCRQLIDDASAVLDLAPTHSPPDLVRDARVHRSQAVGLLHNSLMVTGIDREKALALEDCRLLMADPETNERTKALVSFTASSLDINAIKSIRASFLNKKDLSQVEGLCVGSPDQPRHFVARSYMDKAGPVAMTDGTPKCLPPGIMSVDSMLHMTPAQLNSTFGWGSGTFFGETIFWKRYKGILLGKHKWESTGEMENDVATLSECWDMRWVFPTPEHARNFHRDMLAACRLENNNGYLDSMRDLRLNSSERESLDEAIEELVVVGSFPKKRPCIRSMEYVMMRVDPTAYLQQYTAVFVVGNIVVKLFTIEGFNPKGDRLQRSVMFGRYGLLNVTTRTIKEWWEGKRTQFMESGNSLPEFGDLTRCGSCGTKRDDLKLCTRCLKVAYCTRDCQVSHFKAHKIPCKKAAASSY